MAETVNLKTLKVKLWIKEKTDKAKSAAKATINWAARNPMLAIAVGGMGTKCITSICKAYRDHNEMVRRERRFYDPRMGGYTTIRRDLKHNEKEQAEMRYKNGESWHHIFMDMDLLK